tara:strand:+ start:398 stop:664 length:267 start_codon:yes stop_codon:yes gene_type:complete
MDTNRVSKELREIASDGASGVSVELVSDSLAHMRGTITGAVAAFIRVYDATLLLLLKAMMMCTSNNPFFFLRLGCKIIVVSFFCVWTA